MGNMYLLMFDIKAGLPEHAPQRKYERLRLKVDDFIRAAVSRIDEELV